MAQRSIGKQRIMGDRQTEGSEVAQSPNRSQKPPFPFPGHLQGHRRYEKEREHFTGMQTRAASGYLRIKRPFPIRELSIFSTAIVSFNLR